MLISCNHNEKGMKAGYKVIQIKGKNGAVYLYDV